MAITTRIRAGDAPRHRNPAVGLRRRVRHGHAPLRRGADHLRRGDRRPDRGAARARRPRRHLLPELPGRGGAPGDTVASLAARVGLPAGDLASYNGLPPDASLRAGELVALPRRVAEPSPATGAATTGPIRPSSEISVATIAAPPSTAPRPAQRQLPPRPRRGPSRAATASPRGRDRLLDRAPLRRLGRRARRVERPRRHRTVRVGQYLLIPPTQAVAAAARPRATSLPGQGSATPMPPSAAQPLPAGARRRRRSRRPRRPTSAPPRPAPRTRRACSPRCRAGSCAPTPRAGTTASTSPPRPAPPVKRRRRRHRRRDHPRHRRRADRRHPPRQATCSRSMPASTRSRSRRAPRSAAASRSPRSARPTRRPCTSRCARASRASTPAPT